MRTLLTASAALVIALSCIAPACADPLVPSAANLLIAAGGGGGAGAETPGGAGQSNDPAQAGQGLFGGSAGSGGGGGGGGSFDDGGGGGGGVAGAGGNGAGSDRGSGGATAPSFAGGGAYGGGDGGFGGGGGAGVFGGGGGGGYSGGGGGGSGSGGGGGGGSSYLASAFTSTSGTSGTNTGNGVVTLMLVGGLEQMFTYTGAPVDYTVMVSGVYDITAAGAQGGTYDSSPLAGGLGAMVGGDIDLTEGDILEIFVGQMGGSNNNNGAQGGGGGGTFVFDLGGAAVPEPASLPVLAVGLAVLATGRARRRPR
jgi:hypothetical protein